MYSAAWWPTLIVVAVATVTDLRRRRIPNWLALPFLIAGFAVSGPQHSLNVLAQSAAALTIGAALFGFLLADGRYGNG